MEIQKTSEKLIIWMHRNSITQIKLAEKLGITRQSLAKKLDNNFFQPDEITKLKRIGFNY